VSTLSARVKSRRAKIGLAAALVLLLIGGIVAGVRYMTGPDHTTVTAYFDNTNGIYVGDDVVILGMPVGKIDKIEPQPNGSKVTFWYDSKYKVPADAKAVILSPQLVTLRSIQLTPAYTSGSVMVDHAQIPRDRTAVPVEFDDLRQALQKLTDTLQPTQPGGVSTLGAAVNTLADNLRGQGANIRAALIQLSGAVSALGDHSGDAATTLKNLATLVSALRDSSGVLTDLNQNLASVTGLVSSDSNAVGNAVKDLNDVVGDVSSFVSDNREALGTTSDKLASVSTAVVQSLDDIKQTLHLAPNAFQNFINIYQPSQGTLTGMLGANNLANPLQFICGAIEAASRLNAEQSAKLCVQYLAPIVKNRQYNFFPLGENLFVGEAARPNEVTYGEDWLRPDYIPPSPMSPEAAAAAAVAPTPPGGQPLPPANEMFNYFGNVVDPSPNAPHVPNKPPNATPTDPAAGLPGMMVPPGGGN
jgi:phospholipid/cholesterol/gamma-HCH transport system substrate-binding protein